MAECLEFGIGISSIVFVEINKCISPLFLKTKHKPFYQLLKTVEKLLQKNPQQTKTTSFQMAQSTKFLVQGIHHPKASSLLTTLWKTLKDQAAEINSGGQQYCSVAKRLCNSEEEAEDQILVSTTSIEVEQLLNLKHRATMRMGAC